MDRPLTLLLMAVLGLATSCGGGSNPVNSPPGGSNLIAAFQGESNPGAQSVALGEGTSSGNILTLDVNVAQTNGVYGGAFDLRYDAGMATYSSYSAGSLLQQGGHTPFYQVDDSQPGRLIVVATRQGNVQGVNATTGVPLIRLVFQLTAAGTSGVSFAGTPALFDNQTTPQPLPGINWFGGSFVAN